jgi:hypothetical protein
MSFTAQQAIGTHSCAACRRTLLWLRPISYWGGGGLLHVEMFAHNKSGIAYRDGNRRSETVVNHKKEPHQQPRLLLSCTN